MLERGIGDTIFTRSRNIEKLLCLSKIWLKFEGGNPTGSMKDRAAYACLSLAKDQGFKAVAIASCGNFGASFAHLSKDFDMVAHVYVPSQYHTPRIHEIERSGGILHRADGTYEELVELSIKEARERGWYNANPGSEENTKRSIKAYGNISYEIHEHLGYAPDMVAVPIGNGTTLAGIYYGFRRLLEDGLTDKVPRMIAASTIGGNPVVECYLKGRRTFRNIKAEEVTETAYNEPLVAWRALDGKEALRAIYESDGWATYVTDDMMKAFSDLLLRKEGLSVLPASSSSLAALAEYAKINENNGKDMAAFLSARNY